MKEVISTKEAETEGTDTEEDDAEHDEATEGAKSNVANQASTLTTTKSRGNIRIHLKASSSHSFPRRRNLLCFFDRRTSLAHGQVAVAPAAVPPPAPQAIRSLASETQITAPTPKVPMRVSGQSRARTFAAARGGARPQKRLDLL